MSISLPLTGFSFPDEYYSEYSNDVDGNGNSASIAALATTQADSLQTTLSYGIDPSTGTIYADTYGSVWNADPADNGAFTGSNADEVAEIKAAEQQGLSVMVRPTINFLSDDAQGSLDPYNANEFRADYLPTPGTINNFFITYKAMLDQEAQNALAGGAQYLCVGTELNYQLTSATYQSQWDDIIASVRAIDPNLKLTYSAPADYYTGTTTVNPSQTVSFADKLDYIGVDDYLPLVELNAISYDGSNDPTEAELAQAWTATPTPGSDVSNATGGLSPLAYLEAMSQSAGKPLLLTEIGYQDDTGAAASPDGESGYFQGVPDQSLQNNLYQAFFDAIGSQPFSGIAGAYFWNWDPSQDLPTSDYFSPEGLQAQGTVTAGFASAAKPFVIDLTNTSESNTLVDTDTISGNSELVIQGDPANGGLGAVQITGNNSYTGGTLIVDGDVSLANSNGFGTGGVFVSSGAILNLFGYHSIAIPELLGGGTIIASETAIGMLLTTSAPSVTLQVGSGVFTGRLQDAPRQFVDRIGNASKVVTGPADPLSIDKVGTGTLTLSGNSTNTGATEIDGGTLIIGNTGAGSGAFEFTGPSQNIVLQSSALTADSGTATSSFVGATTLTNLIENFQPGDSIDLAGVGLGQIAGFAYNAGNGSTVRSAYELAISGLTSVANGTVDLQFADNFANSSFAASDDGNGGTLITTSIKHLKTGLTVQDISGSTFSPPTVAFNGGASFSSATQVTFSGTAADVNGVSSVDIRNGATDLGQATLNGDGTWTFSGTLAAGTYQNIQAVATNVNGQVANTAAPFTLTTGITGASYVASENDLPGGQAASQTLSASMLALTVGAGLQGVTLVGNFNTVTLADGTPFGVTGSSNSVIANTGALIFAAGDSGNTVFGSSNTIAAATGDAVGVSGNGNAIYASGSVVFENAMSTGNTLVGSGNTANVANQDSLGVTGNGNALYGSAATFYLNAGDNGDTVLGSGDTINVAAGDAIGVTGGGDALYGAQDTFYINAGSSGDTVVGQSDTINLASGVVAGVTGSGNALYGSNTTIFANAGSNGNTVIGAADTINIASGDALGVTGSGNTINASGDTLYFNPGSSADTVNGANDVLNVSAGDAVGLTGSGGTIFAASATLFLNAGSAGATTNGDGNAINLAGNVSAIVNGSSNNVAIFGQGDQVTVAGPNDVVQYQPGFGQQELGGFSGANSDVIALSSTEYANFAALQSDAKQAGSDTVITGPGGESLKLDGVAANSLTSAMFKFF